MGNGFAVGQGCGFLNQWVTGCCLGLYSRWVAVVICWWATGCCGGSPTVSANLLSPFIFFFFHFCLIFLVRGFVGLIAFRKMLSWWVCGFVVMVGLL